MSYENLDGLNWSSLKHIHESPLLYRHRVDNPPPRTAAFDFGAAVHCAVFEPESLDGRFQAFDGKRDARTKAYQAWLENNPGVTAMKPAEMEKIYAIAEAVRTHPEARKWIDSGRAEVQAQWVEPWTEVKAKGRFDYVRDRVIDLKTTQDVAAWATGKAAGEYLYHGQLAWYHNGAIGARMIDPGAPPPVIVWVEKEPPFDVAVDEMTLDQVAAGEECYVKMVRTLQACAEMDSWPGKAPALRTLALPHWAPGVKEEAMDVG